MPNGYLNKQVGVPLSNSGKGLDGSGYMPKGGGSPGMKEKPGFAIGAPGKTQSKDRSGGVKRIQQSPKTEGL